jgi:sugar/nucleoside kinase (ribokinase family)/D-arabinose 5-phosphate isomerase GutQ
MPEATLDLIGCGSMVVDVFYRTPRIIAADEKILLQAHDRSGEVERRQVGGLVLNHLGWASILGMETGIFGKMGDDANGAFLRRGMDRFGIRHHLTLDGDASSFAAVFVDRDGNRAIYMCRGATGELRPSDVRGHHASFIKRARWISTEISQLPLRTVIAILTLARQHSIPTVLDLDLPPSDACALLGTRAEFERALRLATILKPAKAAARELAGRTEDPLKMAAKLRARYGNEAVVLTAGAQGCAIVAEQVAVRVPAFKVKVVDTTGAGDAFLGAMVAGLRVGLAWPEVGRLANAAGAVCATQLGAFPDRPELRSRIEKLYGGRLGTAQQLPKRASCATKDTPTAARGGLDDDLANFFDLCLKELGALRAKLDLAAIWRAVDLIRAAQQKSGRVHVTGVGKPEHVARYVASLLSSIGTMATFLHATETLHGSLGQVHEHDVVIAISNSGNTAEICAAAIAIKEHGAALIAVTGDQASELARIADLTLAAPVEREGGRLGLAPRTSIMAEIYVLAGLSVALESARGLTAEEYGRWHRAGALGEAARRLAAARTAQRG